MASTVSTQKRQGRSDVTAVDAGYHAGSENVRLLQGILRGEWGFDGLWVFMLVLYKV
jgi:beta-glucosidase-like glycosyl hydrolase